MIKRNPNGRYRKTNVLERLERHACDLIEGDCWLNTYAPYKDGYKTISDDSNHTRFVHRLAWEAHNAEPIPEGMVVMHICDNPACFNPEHLTIGTVADNNEDCRSKGRHGFRLPTNLIHALDEAIH